MRARAVTIPLYQSDVSGASKKLAPVRAKVDAADAPRVNEHDWYWKPGLYPVAWIDGTPVLLHNFIFGEVPDDRLIDHVDRNRLNCTRKNLRLATHSQNNANRKARKGAGRKGLYLHAGRWHVAAKREGIRWCFGSYPDREFAARVYDAAARQIHGVFAYLNFPKERAHPAAEAIVRYVLEGGDLRRVVSGHVRGLRGVRKVRGRYRASIVLDGHTTHLGMTDSAQDAARLYDSAAVGYFGLLAYGRMNYPGEWDWSTLTRKMPQEQALDGSGRAQRPFEARDTLQAKSGR